MKEEQQSLLDEAAGELLSVEGYADFAMFTGDDKWDAAAELVAEAVNKLDENAAKEWRIKLAGILPAQKAVA